MIKEYSRKKDGSLRLTEHFQVWEFACQDGTDKLLHDSELSALLEKLYSRLESKGYKVRAIDVNSGYRTPAHDKAVGGSGKGQHVEGRAADINVRVLNETEHTDNRNGTIYVNADYLCCLLQELGCLGIGYMGGIAVHCDTRTRKWWGDERTGNDTIKDWWAYFGFEPEKPAQPETPAAPPDISYQAYIQGRGWLPAVTNYGEGSDGYAGIYGKPISGVYAWLSAGSVKYRLHIAGRWLPWVVDRQDYAGILGTQADGVQMQLVDLPGYHIQYRVADTAGKYWAWVTDYGEGSEGYAGSFGKPFTGLQCRIVRA